MNFRKLPGPFRVALAGLLIAVIALIDWRVDPPISFGFLYLFPILLIGTVSANRWPIVATALLCMVLAHVFAPYSFEAQFSISLPQDVLVFTPLAAPALFAYKVTRRPTREPEH